MLSDGSLTSRPQDMPCSVRLMHPHVGLASVKLLRVDATRRNATSSLPTAAARRFLHELRSWRTQLQFRATVVSVATVVPAVAKGVKTTISHTSRKTCVWFAKVWKRREKRSEKSPARKMGAVPGPGIGVVILLPAHKNKKAGLSQLWCL